MVVTAVVGLVASSIAASYIHPVLALFAGILIGVTVAAPVAGVIAAWPVLRVIWWWLPEITAFAVLVYGFWLLCLVTSLQVRIVLLFLLASPLVFPSVRSWCKRPVWCLVTRHRLRTCFAEFIIANNRGSLPLLLGTVPTKVGERVWLWLRPGLSLADVQGCLDHIATGCWAAQARAEAASATNSALVRLDIIRRDGLTGTVVSELPDHISGQERDSGAQDDAPVLPADAGLNLRDVPEITTETGTAQNGGTSQNGKTRTAAMKAVKDSSTSGTQTGPQPAMNTHSAGGDDAADWI
ncbi:hypothetical protein [Actinomadura rupiterrae]|uniref:hypothetical protein n=1 Tax=Actinomadura rupiterrae TaxID=559627 RepID=UPI0020A44804|nr:hypothetical protein [Actinomadura rupiterrae]MCP2341027.1 hypothetical protein [Actinomadura rupiterrae]